MALFDKKQKQTNQNLPKHIAIIMDGNGRWAKERNLARTAGHKAGSESLKKIVEECNKIGIEHLTVYAFSTENWNRPQKEVETLMNYFDEYLQKYIDESDKTDIKVNVIGDVTGLESRLQEKIAKLEEKGKDKTGLKFHIAINYGGRDEIVRAMKKMSLDLVNNKISSENISSELFEKYLDTAGTPDPELIIRTSGEQRLSNFLLWQAAYSEFYFSPKFWPDFDEVELHKALENYTGRNRRFGKV